MVTRFECPTLLALCLVYALHLRIKRSVRRDATGFLDATVLVDWRRRTLLNISLWTDVDSIYSMGQVDLHVSVAHLPPRLGVRTSGGVFCYAGDWRRVLFGSRHVNPSPLFPLAAETPAGESTAATEPGSPADAAAPPTPSSTQPATGPAPAALEEA